MSCKILCGLVHLLDLLYQWQVSGTDTNDWIYLLLITKYRDRGIMCMVNTRNTTISSVSVTDKSYKYIPKW